MDKRGRILVVEDERVVALALTDNLSRVGWTVAGSAASGEAAIELAAQESPDLILMDVKLAGKLDGPEAAVQIRQQLGIPSIFLTAYSDSQTLERCKKAEPAGYLLKPVSTHALTITLEMALNTERLRREREVAEAARREAKAAYTAVLDHSPDAILAIDANQLIVTFNMAAERIFQYPAHEAVGKPIDMLLPQSDGSGDIPGISGLGDVGAGPLVLGTPHPVRARRRDGELFPCQVTVFGLKDGGTGIVGVIIRDVSEHAALRQQFEQAQRMQTVGQLSASMAHDFNNLLMALEGFHFVLKGNEGMDQELLDSCRATIRHGGSLTRQILNLSRSSASSRCAIDLNEATGNLAKFAVHAVGPGIAIDVRTAPDAGYVYVNDGQFEQVVLNLIINARDAMPNGGRLILETALAEDPDFACLTISDTGAGIEPDVLPQIFRAFFTTKPVDRGTGLGLSTAKRLVEEWGGSISVESQVGKGARFSLRLPRALQVPTSDAAAEMPLTGDEQVLLVVDDRRLGLALSRLLQSQGYRVHATHTLRDARNALQNGHAPRIIISDLVLSDGSIADMIEASSGIPILLLAERGQTLELPEHVHVLHKRTPAERLLGAIRELCNSVHG